LDRCISIPYGIATSVLNGLHGWQIVSQKISNNLLELLLFIVMKTMEIVGSVDRKVAKDARRSGQLLVTCVSLSMQGDEGETPAPDRAKTFIATNGTASSLASSMTDPTHVAYRGCYLFGLAVQKLGSPHKNL
jgi:hypothetical protein